MEKSRKEGLCSICWEKGPVVTNCGHFFCGECLDSHLKSSATCPVCRAPCSEKVLGEGYICQTHRERVRFFCEGSSLLLCKKCRESPEHQPHQELTIEHAVSHYKERLSRRIRKLRKELERRKALEKSPQTQQQLDQLEDMQEKARLFHESCAAQLSCLITDLERVFKQLEANMLKDASDLLDSSAPQKLEAIYQELEKKPNGSPPPLPSASLTCSSLDHVISDSSQRLHSPSLGFPCPTLGLPVASSDLPSPEHIPLSASPQP